MDSVHRTRGPEFLSRNFLFVATTSHYNYLNIQSAIEFEFIEFASENTTRISWYRKN